MNEMTALSIEATRNSRMKQTLTGHRFWLGLQSARISIRNLPEDLSEGKSEGRTT